MALSDESAALRARNLITERGDQASGLSIPKIISVIPSCIEIWARETLKAPNKRREFDRQIEIEFVDGVADISPYLDGSLEKIDRASFGACAGLTFDDADTPVKWVNSYSQLKYPRDLDDIFITLFLDGDVIRSRNTSGSLSTLSGTATGTFSVIPSDTSGIPPALEGEFISMLAQMSVGGANFAHK